jgi:ATP-dependent DNA helicase RecG
MSNINLNDNIFCLNFIGQKRTLMFHKIGIKNIYDIITYFPIKYEDRTKIISINNAFYKKKCSVFVEIGNFYEKKFFNFSILDIEIYDGISTAYARFFRINKKYLNIDIFARIKKDFKSGKFAYIYGNIQLEYYKKILIVNDYEIIKNKNDKPLYFKTIIPIYHTTNGLSQKFIRKVIKNCLDLYCDLYPNIFGFILNSISNLKLSSSFIIQKIHYPTVFDDIENAKKNFALQEFFVFQIIVLMSKNKFKKLKKQQKYILQKKLFLNFKNSLNFEFTNCQKKAINEIFNDMKSLYQMNRILVGDVGSGKTVVALSAIILAIENGYQSMIVVPTEILAEQHFITISNILSKFNIKIVLVTSKTMYKNKKKILFDIEFGNINIAIGTHSLIEDRIKFKNLSLVVIDEQHRFGVIQRFLLSNKSKKPDILMMSATPIPRTLAMIIYSEMDVSIIYKLPFGRKQIKTCCSDEQHAYMNAIKELKKGNQIYIVYPLIDKSDKIILKSVNQEYKKLSNTLFKNFNVGFLHGKMKFIEKQTIMKKFREKKINILISTSVIEAGIDIQSATVMIIHHAERFGLSTLHQLRGRVGRGSKQSYVYFVNNSKDFETNKKLSIMISTNDGFKIAKEDLKMRGPGQFDGTIQHGLLKFKIANLVTDFDIFEIAKKSAINIINSDPKLLKKKNIILKNFIFKHLSDNMKFVDV